MATGFVSHRNAVARSRAPASAEDLFRVLRKVEQEGFSLFHLSVTFLLPAPVEPKLEEATRGSRRVSLNFNQHNLGVRSSGDHDLGFVSDGDPVAGTNGFSVDQ